MDNEKDKINELVDMLDMLMNDGKGHVNVYADDKSSDADLTVQTFVCSDCGCSKREPFTDDENDD